MDCFIGRGIFVKILLAEDDKNVAVISKMALEKIGGHDVEWVQNGEEALEKALTNTYDLIILDEMMPKMNGIKACQQIRLKDTNNTPIIFLSAKNQPEDIENFLSIGDGHIPKPFNPSTLCTIIDETLTNLQGYESAKTG